MTARQESPRPLEDEDLLEEITLLLEVIITASEYPNHLTSQQIDAALQLPVRSLPALGPPAEAVRTRR